MLDVERGKPSDINEDYSQTDATVSYKEWCYVDGDYFKTVATLVHDLVDIVSKNGSLLSEWKDKPFNAQDIRFTIQDQVLYAICLGWPGESAIIKSLGIGSPVNAEQITSIGMLGSPESLLWSQREDGLHVTTPA